MIQPNELRIGNWIASSNQLTKSDPQTWVIGKVLSIRREECEFEQVEVETEEDNSWFFSGNYFGIPLDEEWLLKFGFKRNTDVYYKNFGQDDLVWHINDKGLAINGEWVASIKFHFVHQLQNLYLALTGEELEIKE